MSPETCRHANCACPPSTEHLPYCGPYCANAGERASLPGDADPEGACACRHDACRAGQEPHPKGEPVRTATGD
jgi:hypothetical protein